MSNVFSNFFTHLKSIVIELPGIHSTPPTDVTWVKCKRSEFLNGVPKNLYPDNLLLVPNSVITADSDDAIGFLGTCFGTDPHLGIEPDTLSERIQNAELPFSVAVITRVVFATNDLWSITIRYVGAEAERTFIVHKDDK